MPGNILDADTGFPSFTEDMTNDQKIDKVMNYLYMLLEQLRYTLSNLGVDNFNDTEIDDLAKIITDPVYLRLEDEMGNLTSLQVTVNGLTSRVQNNEGKISQVTQTADGLVTRVSTAEGNISTLTQTASGLSSRVSTAEGNISTLTQTANSLESRISNAEGAVSEIWQEIDGIGLVVSDGELNTASIVAAINDSGSSAMISADKIKMTGTTTFISSSKKSDGELEIDGNSLGIYINGALDNGSEDITSRNGVNFYYDRWGDGTEVSKMSRIYTKIAGETDDINSRYALCIDTLGFAKDGEVVSAALKLLATGRGSFEARSLYLNGYIGNISLDAAFNTRIFAPRTYDELEILADNGYPEAESVTGYCFCSDGIYYNGVKLLSV